MASLEELRRSVFPTATDLAAVPDEGRTVGWVRVLKSRVPAFDALERTDLAILPEPALEALAAAGLEPASVADALERAGAAAALVMGEGGPAPSATAAAEQLHELGIPAYRLEGADPAVVERSVIGFLVNDRAELERQAARLEQQLAALALRGAELSEHAAAMAAFLGRAVAIEGPRGESLAIHAPQGQPDAAAAAARYLRRPRRAALRVPLPAVGGDASGRPSGSLALLGEAPATELERLCCAGVASLLALELARAEPERGSGRTERLPADGPPWVVLVARQVTADGPNSVDERAQLRARLRRLAPARRLALRGDPTSLEIRAVVAASHADPEGTALAARAAAILERQVAVSRPFREPEERAVAEAEARATLEAVEALGSADPAGALRIVRADRLAVYRLLGSLHNLPDGERQAELLLEPLLSGRSRRRAELLRTLRAVLDAPGLAEAATRLGIHRNTLAYRLARIEAVTGWRLEDGDLRTALAVAVRLVQNDQIEGSQTGPPRARRRRSTA